MVVKSDLHYSFIDGGPLEDSLVKTGLQDIVNRKIVKTVRQDSGSETRFNSGTSIKSYNERLSPEDRRKITRISPKNTRRSPEVHRKIAEKSPEDRREFAGRSLKNHRKIAGRSPKNHRRELG